MTIATNPSPRAQTLQVENLDNALPAFIPQQVESPYQLKATQKKHDLIAVQNNFPELIKERNVHPNKSQVLNPNLSQRLLQKVNTDRMLENSSGQFTVQMENDRPKMTLETNQSNAFLVRSSRFTNSTNSDGEESRFARKEYKSESTDYEFIQGLIDKLNN